MIFCLMGKSSSGKDTLYQKIMQKKELHLEKIVPYTTRPIREGEQEGREYHFCSREEKQKLAEANKIIEIRNYQTVYGTWSYFTVDDGQLDLMHKNYLSIGTLEAYVKLADYYGKDNVVPIYIEVEDGKRLMRAILREQAEEKPKYEELCRRFLADAADFSVEKRKQAGIEKVFVNDKIDETMDAITAYIQTYIQ